MKINRYLLLLIGTLLIFASCKKSSDSPADLPVNTITATFGDYTETFDVNVVANSDTSIYPNLLISGIGKREGDLDAISITVGKSQG